MKKYLMEFIGTFFLVFAIGAAVMQPTLAGFGPFVFGGVLMAMIYAGGHICKAHYNPVVTLAFFLQKGIEKYLITGYLISQLLASLLASFAALYAFHNPSLTDISTPLALEIGPAFLAEFLGTFALVFVIMNVAAARATRGNPYFGLAIASTVLGMAYAVGPLSGAAFNPAVTLALILFGLGDWLMLAIHLPAQLIAATLATYIFLYMEGGKQG